jgi:hypothetical protein
MKISEIIADVNGNHDSSLSYRDERLSKSMDPNDMHGLSLIEASELR